MKRALAAAVTVGLIGISVAVGPPATDPAAGAAHPVAITPADGVGRTAWSATDPVAAGQAAGPGEDGSLTNDELVVASLDPLGLPMTANLISRITSVGGPQRTIVDPTSTSNIAYLNMRGQPTARGGGIEITIGGPDPVVIITKAELEKTLPVALHAEYSLDGRIVDPDETVGASGDVAIRFTVTNVDVKQKELNYELSSGKKLTSTEPIFAPFVGTLTTVLPDEYEVKSSKDAVVSTDGKGNTVLTWNLLLYPPMGNYRQVVGFEAKTESGVVPMTTLAAAPVANSQDPAVGFAADMFDQSVKSTQQLTDGVRQLDDNTLTLANGAAQLSAGLTELDSGLDETSDGVSGQLEPGTQELADGATATAAGQRLLADAIGTEADGADELYTGAQVLAAGLTSLSDGLDVLANSVLPDIRDGAKKIRAGAVQLADGVGSSSDPPIPTPCPTATALTKQINSDASFERRAAGVAAAPTPTPTAAFTLVQIIDATVLCTATLVDEAETLAANLDPIVTSISDNATASGTASTDAGSAVTTLDTLLGELCGASPTITPAQCDELQSARDDADDAATESGAVATDLTLTAADAETEALRALFVAVGLNVLELALEEIQTGIHEVSVGLRSGSYVPGEEGIVEGMDELLAALNLTIVGAKILDAGGEAAVEGADELAVGNGALATGLDETDAGAQTLVEAADQLAAGATQAAFGTAQVADALAALSEGADEAASGGDELATGAKQLQELGTQEMLRSVIESSEQPALAQAWLDAASDRAQDALPYGLPKGATGSAAYVLTMAPVEPSDSWAWQLAAIIILGLSALVGAALKQSLTTRREERG